MNKRTLIIVISAIVCISVLVGLNNIKSFDGYYSSIENVVAHESTVRKGGDKIALIKNGSGSIAIIRLENAFTFYNFKTKSTLTGKKYAVSSYQRYNIDYDSVTQTPPVFNEWKFFSTTIFNNSDEKDLIWCVVKKSNETVLEDDVKSLDYSYDGTEYCLLYAFV